MARPLLSPANSMEDAIFPFAAPTSNAIGDKPNIKLKVDIVGSFVDTCAPPKVSREFAKKSQGQAASS